MRTLLFFSLLIFCNGILKGQNSAIKISGRVYVKYYKPTSKQNTVAAYNQYISEVKVILVPSEFSGDVLEIKRRMNLFCGNDRETIERFKARLVYTDRNGNYDFAGVRTNKTYFVIFCDKKMQMSEITTRNKAITYKLRDKQVYL